MPRRTASLLGLMTAARATNDNVASETAQEKLDAFKAKIGADQMPAVFREETLGTRVTQAIFELDRDSRWSTLARQSLRDDLAVSHRELM